MERLMITITKDEYEELLEQSIKYELLLATIYENASLSYTKELYIDGGTDLSKILKHIDSFDYNKKLKELKEREKNNESN